LLGCLGGCRGDWHVGAQGAGDLGGAIVEGEDRDQSRGDLRA
jgi:hypothetical protein